MHSPAFRGTAPRWNAFVFLSIHSERDASGGYDCTEGRSFQGISRRALFCFQSYQDGELVASRHRRCSPLERYLEDKALRALNVRGKVLLFSLPHFAAARPLFFAYCQKWRGIAPYCLKWRGITVQICSCAPVTAHHCKMGNRVVDGKRFYTRRFSDLEPSHGRIDRVVQMPPWKKADPLASSQHPIHQIPTDRSLFFRRVCH